MFSAAWMHFSCLQGLNANIDCSIHIRQGYNKEDFYEEALWSISANYTFKIKTYSILQYFLSVLI